MNNVILPKKSTKRPLVWAIALALAGSGWAQQSLSLQECLQAGLQGNHDLKRLEVGSELFQAQVDQAKSSYYPVLKASGSLTNMWDKPVVVMNGIEMEQGKRWNVSGGLTLTQPIFVAQALTGIKVAQKGLELDGLSKQAQQEGVVMQLSTLYWSVAYLEENQKVLEKSRENLGRVKETVQALVQNGVAKKSDVNSMDISLASLDLSVEKVANQVELQKTALLQAMGRDHDQKMVLADKLSAENRNTTLLAQYTMQDSKSIQILEKQVELKDMQESLAGQSRWPTVVAFAKYTGDGSSESFDFHENTTDKFTDTGVLGIQVDVPLFDGMASSISKKQARLEKRQLQIDLEKKRQSLQADSANAVRSLQTAQNQVERQIANVKMAEENFAMKEMEYQEQVASLSDLLTAENDVISARSGLVEALFNEKTAELELKQVLGLLAQEVK